MDYRWEDLTDDQLALIREAFSLFDHDDDGSIASGELGTVMNSLGHCPTEAELQDIINEVDTNENGRIELSEFLTLMIRILEESETDLEEEIQEVFHIFDKNKTGFIMASDIRHVMTVVGQPISDYELLDIFKQTDLDNDGRISYDDFKNIMRNANNV